MERAKEIWVLPSFTDCENLVATRTESLRCTEKAPIDQVPLRSLVSSCGNHQSDGFWNSKSIVSTGGEFPPPNLRKRNSERLPLRFYSFCPDRLSFRLQTGLMKVLRLSVFQGQGRQSVQSLLQRYRIWYFFHRGLQETEQLYLSSPSNQTKLWRKWRRLNGTLLPRFLV